MVSPSHTKQQERGGGRTEHTYPTTAHYHTSPAPFPFPITLSRTIRVMIVPDKVMGNGGCQHLLV